LKPFYFVILLLSLYSCENKVYVSQLRVSEEFKYYHKGKLFTGIAIDTQTIYPQQFITGNIHFKNGLKDGYNVWNYENGNKYEECTYKNGKRNGTELHYREDGSLNSKRNLWNGIEDGKQYHYYGNGQLWYIETYDKGHQRGLRLEYYKNGQLSRRQNYIDNMILDGEVLEYYPNGNLRLKYHVKDGSHPTKWNPEHGWFYEFYENGILKNKAHFKNGNQDGADLTYDSTGVLMCKCIFKNDKEIKCWGDCE
jgi:antitoxin component YwqK of YwqJK toxin-antitoxin module